MNIFCWNKTQWKQNDFRNESVYLIQFRHLFLSVGLGENSDRCPVLFALWMSIHACRLGLNRKIVFQKGRKMMPKLRILWCFQNEDLFPIFLFSKVKFRGG